jgi:hypothetical protein
MTGGQFVVESCLSGPPAQLLDVSYPRGSPLASQREVVTVDAGREGSLAMIEAQATTCPSASGRFVITVSVENDLVVVNRRVALHLATRDEREHERFTTSIHAQGCRPVKVLSRRPLPFNAV